MKMVFQEKLSYLINRLRRKLKVNIFPLKEKKREQILYKYKKISSIMAYYIKIFAYV